MLDLSNPFQGEVGAWISEPFQTCLDLDSDLDSEREWGLIGAPDRRTRVARAPRRALREMRALLADRESPAPSMLRSVARMISRYIPKVPVPVVRHGAATAGPVLRALLRHCVRSADLPLAQEVGTLLYRFLESRGRYEEARVVIAGMIARARESGAEQEIAVLTNNLGYEHLLEGDHQAAEGQFEHAVTLFDRVEDRSGGLNCRANLLECRFAQVDPSQWYRLVPTLRDLHRAMVDSHDWRVRKTLRLLARLAEARDRRQAACRIARRALAVSAGIPTRLRDWDREYLEALEASARR